MVPRWRRWTRDSSRVSRNDLASPAAEGLRVLDFSQFLAGPYAALKLADMGADVVKVERVGTGDLSRHLYLTDTRSAAKARSSTRSTATSGRSRWT